MAAICHNTEFRAMEIVITQPTQCEGKRTDGTKPLIVFDIVATLEERAECIAHQEPLSDSTSEPTEP
jgi:hypothetical protein